MVIGYATTMVLVCQPKSTKKHQDVGSTGAKVVLQCRPERCARHFDVEEVTETVSTPVLTGGVAGVGQAGRQFSSLL